MPEARIVQKIPKLCNDLLPGMVIVERPRACDTGEPIAGAPGVSFAREAWLTCLRVSAKSLEQPNPVSQIVLTEFDFIEMHRGYTSRIITP